MPSPNRPLTGELVLAMERLADTFQSRSIRYAVLGGIATTLHGRPRFTQDVDILLDVPQIALPGLLDELAALGFQFDAGQVIREYVRENMTTLRFGVVRIDWLKPALPVYGRAIANATCMPWTEGHEIRVVSPESLILTKLIAFRPQDQEDIRTLLIANRKHLDRPLIESEWAAIADADDERTIWINQALADLDQSR